MATKSNQSIYTGNTIGENIKNQLKSFPRDLGQQFFEQAVKPLPEDVIEQLTGKARPQKETAGQREQIVIFSAKEEQKRQEMEVKDMLVKRQIEIIRSQLAAEQRAYQAQVNQLKETIETMAKSIDIKVNLSVEQPGEKAGVYHTNFLEKMLSLILTKVDQAKDWSQRMTARARGKRPQGLQVFWQKGASQQQITEQGTMMLQG